METLTIQERANQHGKSFAEDARKMLDALEDSNDDENASESARDEIDSLPLSLCVRSAWTPLGNPMEAAEYEILLSTGGPASRIVGELGSYGEVESARYEFQDWGEPWTPALFENEDDAKAILAFAQQFSFYQEV